MDDMRARTLETLSAYIQSQRELLSRTQHEIERLHALKSDVKAEEDITVDDVMQKLDPGVFGLDEEAEPDTGIARAIDWSLFQSKDSSSLNKLAAESRAAHIHRSQPSKTQSSEPSYLQSFVRNRKSTIIDPLFTYLSKDPLFIEAQAEAEAQAEIPQTVDSIHSLKTPQRCPIGAGHRRMPGLRLVCNRTSHADIALTNPNITEVDPPKLPLSSDPSPAATPCLPYVKVTGGRRSSRQPPRPPPSSPRKSLPDPKDADKQPQPEDDKPKRSRGRKSVTFKMAWSVEEQRLLERLLEEIPDGEKNRWAKISQAMNGRRTPRQVASRVQKYFEKLKKFGVEVQ